MLRSSYILQYDNSPVASWTVPPKESDKYKLAATAWKKFSVFGVIECMEYREAYEQDGCPRVLSMGGFFSVVYRGHMRASAIISEATLCTAKSTPLKKPKRGSNRKNWYVYLLNCNDGTFYCGITTGINRRLAEHNAGKGAKYTRGRTPCSLAVCSIPMTKSKALAVEAATKKQPRDKKIAYLFRYILIRGCYGD